MLAGAAIAFQPAVAAQSAVQARFVYDDRGGDPVTSMNLAALTIPVLVVHHQEDGCRYCPVSETDSLMKKLTQSPRANLMIVSGGTSQGDPCEAFGYHGFNGTEGDVVNAISAWMLAR